MNTKRTPQNLNDQVWSINADLKDLRQKQKLLKQENHLMGEKAKKF